MVAPCAPGCHTHGCKALEIWTVEHGKLLLRYLVTMMVSSYKLLFDLLVRAPCDPCTGYRCNVSLFSVLASCSTHTSQFFSCQMAAWHYWNWKQPDFHIAGDHRTVTNIGSVKIAPRCGIISIQMLKSSLGRVTLRLDVLTTSPGVSILSTIRIGAVQAQGLWHYSLQCHA